jgi:hypothetical protein
MNITYHTDPGHGWLAVPLSLIRRLNLMGKISACSYIDSAADAPVVYLEEDCDAGLFMNAAKQREITVDIVDRHLNKDHWIRHLRPYQSNHYLHWS